MCIFFAVCTIKEDITIGEAQQELQKGINRLVAREHTGNQRYAELAAQAALRRVGFGEETNYPRQSQGSVYNSDSRGTGSSSGAPTYPHELERIWTQELRRYYDYGVHARPEPVAYENIGYAGTQAQSSGLQNYGTNDLGIYGGSLAQSFAPAQTRMYPNVVIGGQGYGGNVPQMWDISSTAPDVADQSAG